MTNQYPAEIREAMAEAEIDVAADEIRQRVAQGGDPLGETAERGDEGEAIVGRSSTDTASVEAFVADPANADKVLLFSQIDGTPSKVLSSMLRSQLKKRIIPDPSVPEYLWNQKAFDYTPPPADRIPSRMNLPCWLHPDHPNRALYDEIGLAGRTCRKKNIPTLMDAELHAEHKHPKEYRIIKESLAQRVAEDDREAQREQAAALRAMAEAVTAGAQIAAAAAPVAETPADEDEGSDEE